LRRRACAQEVAIALRAISMERGSTLFPPL
jgi:hypothetical protein